MINVRPAALVTEIARVIDHTTPSEQDIFEVRRQVLARQAHLGLKDRAAPECVAESLIRCLLLDHLQCRFKLALDDVPDCINSSHTATRGVCMAPSQHQHHQIRDDAWVKAWSRMQNDHPKVNIHVRGQRSPRRADLYLVTRGEVVSVEFKYVGLEGLRDVGACAVQVQRYVKKHAATLLAIYDGANNGGKTRGLDRLRGLLGPAVRIAVVSGPRIPPK